MNKSTGRGQPIKAKLIGYAGGYRCYRPVFEVRDLSGATKYATCAERFPHPRYSLETEFTLFINPKEPTIALWSKHLDIEFFGVTLLVAVLTIEILGNIWISSAIVHLIALALVLGTIYELIFILPRRFHRMALGDAASDREHELLSTKELKSWVKLHLSTSWVRLVSASVMAILISYALSSVADLDLAFQATLEFENAPRRVLILFVVLALEAIFILLFLLTLKDVRSLKRVLESLNRDNSLTSERAG